MAGDKGFIKLYRDLLDKPIWTNSTAEQKVILVTLLMLAQWQPVEWKILGDSIDLEPGMLFISTRALAAKCGVTHQNVRTALKQLEGYNFLTQRSTHRGTLIKIVNWGTYQSANSGDNTEANTKVTRASHTPNTPNGENQHTNKQEYTYKKERKKEGKNINIGDVISQFAGSNEKLTESITNWVEMRKKMKKPLTVNALKLNLRKLHKLTNGIENDMIRIVDQSTMNGWLSFYPIKQEQDSTPFADTRDFYESIIKGRTTNGNG
jgi:hypothetical protein